MYPSVVYRNSIRHCDWMRCPPVPDLHCVCLRVPEKNSTSPTRSIPEGKPLKKGLWRLTKQSSQYGKIARMSIRMVAVELYRVMKKIEELEKELESLEAGSQERVEIERDLREAMVQKGLVKKMIEGAKDG